MFQKNIEALKMNNPGLAEKLENINIDSVSGIEAFQAESKDLILTYNGVPLHSPIDPIREAKTVWNRTVKSPLKKNDIQLVFGLGLGYLFKRACVSADSKIFVIEPNLEIIRFVTEHVDFSAEFSEKRVYITDNVKDLYEKLYEQYLSGDRIEFLFLNHYASSNSEILANITSKTFEIIESRGSDKNTILNLSKIWTENFIKNIADFPEARPLGYSEGNFSDKTALIISPGSSLSEDIEKIKNNSDKFVTIAVGKAFRQLVKAGIIPDFTVFADAKGCAEQIKGVEDFIEKTHLVMLSKSDNYVYGLKSKSKTVSFLENDAFSKLFKNSEIENPGFYKSGSSVSIISYYFAKALGFEQIIFSGLDLAFIDNKMYADGSVFETNEAGKLKNLNKKIVYIKDREGNDLPTRDDYALFVRQFSEILTEELNLAKIINTSLNGAYINGMEYKSFSETVATLSEVKPDVDKIISETYTETKENWDSALRIVNSELIVIKNELKEIGEQSGTIYEEFNKICTELENTGNISCGSDNYDNLNNSVIDTRQKLINNMMLSTYMQDEIWKYTRNYITKSIPGKNDIIMNFNLDRDFFNDAKTGCTTLTKLLDKITAEQKTPV